MCYSFALAPPTPPQGGASVIRDATEIRPRQILFDGVKFYSTQWRGFRINDHIFPNIGYTRRDMGMKLTRFWGFTLFYSYCNKLFTSATNFSGKFQSSPGFESHLFRAPWGECHCNPWIFSKSSVVVDDSLDRLSTNIAILFDLRLTCSTNIRHSKKASKTWRHLIKIEVSSSFLQYFFS